MIWFVYNILFSIAFILMLPYFFLRMRRRGGYRRHFMQRLGCYTPDVKRKLQQPGRIWMHAVSVGEVFVALRFMEEFRAHDPSCRFVLTVTTSTGHQVAEKYLQESDVLLYFPVDFPPIMNKVLCLIKPGCVLLVETELWPNLIRLARKRGIPVYLVNGRLSERSYKGYRKTGLFVRATLRQLNRLFIQDAAAAERFRALGALPESVHVMGSAKYDTAVPAAAAEQYAAAVLAPLNWPPEARLIVAGSTWPGEEAAMCSIYKTLRSKGMTVRLIIAPRHVERSHEVIAALECSGLSYVRRSEQQISTDGSHDVLLLDTTGELKYLYPCAAVTFIGKSLTQHGGQNPLEAAVYGKPVVVGPHMENFPVIVNEMCSSGGLIMVRDEQEAGVVIADLLENEEMREEIGRKARDTIKRKAGAVNETVSQIRADGC